MRQSKARPGHIKTPPKKFLIHLEISCLILVSLGLIATRPGGFSDPPRIATPTAETYKIYLPLIVQHQGPIPPTPTPGPIADGRGSWGSPIALTAAETGVWVANPDSGSVSLVNIDQLSKVVEIPAGQEPWSLALAPDDKTLYVLDRALGNLLVIDTQRYTLTASLNLGPEPSMLALSPLGSKAYITLTSNDQVLIVDTGSLSISTTLDVAARPFAIAVSDDGDQDETDERVYLSHFLALPQQGGSGSLNQGATAYISVFQADKPQTIKTIPLQNDDHGFPNILAGLALQDNQVWIPHLRASPELPNELSSTVFAAVAVLDQARAMEWEAARLMLNDQDTFGSPVNNPLAAVPSWDGQRLYVVLGGSNIVEVIDITAPEAPALVRFLPTGANPRGIALSRDDRRAYVMNYLGRSITVLDLETLAAIAQIPVTDEPLSAAVLNGKRLFNNASNPKLSQSSWVSCASCHPDGGADGVTWRLDDGPRQTQVLWNLSQTGPWHWSATLDELQDVEETVKVLQHGLGLAPGDDPSLLGQPNAGRSILLDDLVAYLEDDIRPPQPATRQDALQRLQGRTLFISAGCAACHGGKTWTQTTLPGPAGSLDPDHNGMVDIVLRDVGTYNNLDIKGKTGFDIPSLLSAGLAAPYLHDGSAHTLSDLLASGHPDPKGEGNGLNFTEIEALVAFLESIGPDTAPVLNPISTSSGQK